MPKFALSCYNIIISYMKAVISMEDVAKARHAAFKNFRRIMPWKRPSRSNSLKSRERRSANSKLLSRERKQNLKPSVRAEPLRNPDALPNRQTCHLGTNSPPGVRARYELCIQSSHVTYVVGEVGIFVTEVTESH